MMNLNDYMPILRVKTAEFDALTALDAHTKKSITPLYEFRKPPKSCSNDLKGYIEKKAEKCAKSWGEGYPIAFDTPGLSDDTLIANGENAAEYFYKQLASHNLYIIPTITTIRTNEFCKKIQRFSKSFIFRVLVEDLELPSETKNILYNQIKELKCEIKNCHLLIDLRYLENCDTDKMIDLISSFTSKLEIEDWATLTFAGCSFPEDMSGIKKSTKKIIPRLEYKHWLALNEAHLLIGKKVGFADYSIINPLKPEIEGLINPDKIANKIRYTATEEWLVFRGENHEDTDEKYEEYKKLALKIVNDSEFRGAEFSWGDNCILECSTGKQRISGLGKWLKIDINHHITLASQQVCNILEEIKT